MAIYGWDVVIADPLMPLAGQTVNGAPFTVPKGTLGIAIHCPDLVGVASTYKIMSLMPGRDDQEAEAWRDVYVFDLTTGNMRQLTAIPENIVATFPVTATGAGVLRFVASVDQSSLPVRMQVTSNVGR